MPRLTPDQLFTIREATTRRRWTTNYRRLCQQLVHHIAHLETENALLRAGRSPWTR